MPLRKAARTEHCLPLIGHTVHKGSCKLPCMIFGFSQQKLTEKAACSTEDLAYAMAPEGSPDAVLCDSEGQSQYADGACG